MQEVVLKAEPREVIGKQVKALRRAGKLPAVLYGRHIEPKSIVLDLRDASRILDRLAPSALVTIELGSEKHTALVREKQRNFLRGTLLHIDFLVVSMQEKLRTTVALVTHGESRAVKDFNGVLVLNMDQVEVECLPKDLPERIAIDLTSLKRVGDAIHMKDIRLPDGVVLLEDPNTIVAVVTGQASETDEAFEAGPSEPEVIEKGKKDEENF